MILSVTLNPALDKGSFIQKLVPEKKMRCPAMQIEAGGGGVNVSKVVKELNGKCTALFPAGGPNGKRIEELLRKKNIPLKIISIKGETRENFVITDRSTNIQYRFVFPGAVLSRDELDACSLAIETFRPLPDIIVFSGSMPPGVFGGFIKKLAKFSKKHDIKFIADTSDEALKEAVNEGVYLLKPNLSELCALVNRKYLELSEVEPAARSIIDKGKCEVIIVLMGPAGALLLTKNISKRISAPVVKKVSAVGAGDSMVAGITFMLEHDKPLVEVAQFGVACGTAATINSGGQLCKTEDIYRLYEWIKVHEL